jgi:hypothetical protein
MDSDRKVFFDMVSLKGPSETNLDTVKATPLNTPLTAFGQGGPLAITCPDFVGRIRGIAIPTDLSVITVPSGPGVKDQPHTWSHISPLLAQFLEYLPVFNEFMSGEQCLRQWITNCGNGKTAATLTGRKSAKQSKQVSNQAMRGEVLRQIITTLGLNYNFNWSSFIDDLENNPCNLPRSIGAPIQGTKADSKLKTGWRKRRNSSSHLLLELFPNILSFTSLEAFVAHYSRLTLAAGEHAATPADASSLEDEQ